MYGPPGDGNAGDESETPLGSDFLLLLRGLLAQHFDVKLDFAARTPPDLSGMSVRGAPRAINDQTIVLAVE